MSKKKMSHNENDFYRWCALCVDYFVVGKHDHEAHNKAAQQGVQLIALRRGLTAVILISFILLAVVLFTICGN